MNDSSRPAPQVAAAPGGPVLALAKRAAERLLWARVGVQRRLESALRTPPRPIPRDLAPTDVLRTADDWRAALATARRLRLPLHRDAPKNWDALGAVAAVLALGGTDGSPPRRVLDAGSARYSSVLPWLRLYGLGAHRGDLLGINLEFGDPVHRDGVRFQHGDVTGTALAGGSFDAVTCLSVIEHGVPLGPFLRESARLLRPGGVLVISTDYDRSPPDTTGLVAYGAPVRIFGPEGIRRLVAQAEQEGLDLVGELDLPGFFEHAERPVHWARTGLDYTFILLTFRRR